MSKSKLSQIRDRLRKLIPCRLTGRTTDFESVNGGSNPPEGTTRNMFRELESGLLEMQAIKLEEGGTYVIQTEDYLTYAHRLGIEKFLGRYEAFNFILLDGGMKIAKQTKVP